MYGQEPSRTEKPENSDDQVVLYLEEAAMLDDLYEGKRNLKAKQSEASGRGSVFFLPQTGKPRHQGYSVPGRPAT